MSVPPNESTRLDFRLAREQKALIERAAGLLGQTVSQFAIATLVHSAHETIQHAAQTELTSRDRDRFLSMLASDAAPNAALKSAAKRYRARRG